MHSAKGCGCGHYDKPEWVRLVDRECRDIEGALRTTRKLTDPSAGLALTRLPSSLHQEYASRGWAPAWHWACIWDAQVALPAPPSVALVDPPVCCVRCPCDVTVHLSDEAPDDQQLRLVFKHRTRRLAEVPLAGDNRRVVRVPITVEEPGVTTIYLVNGDGEVLEARHALPVLPPDASEEFRQMFLRAVDVIKQSDPAFQAEYLELPIEQVATCLENLDRHILETVWRKSLTPLCEDLNYLLELFWERIETGNLASPISAVAEKSLHNVLVYLMGNQAWFLVAFILETCMQSGLPIAVNGEKIPMGDLQSEHLKQLAQDIRRQHRSGAER